MNLFKRLLGFKPKTYIVHDRYTIVPAFEWKGVTYSMHEDPMNVCVGRGLWAMKYLDELYMRCSADYLKAHIAATKAILSDRTKIELGELFKLNDHMEQRVNMLIAVPAHVYKLASVIYFTKDESPFYYDPVANQKKIEAWEKADMYDFFCTGHLKNLIPSLGLPERDSVKYSEIAEKINQIHITNLREVLSKKGLTADIKN